MKALGEFAFVAGLVLAGWAVSVGIVYGMVCVYSNAKDRRYKRRR